MGQLGDKLRANATEADALEAQIGILQAQISQLQEDAAADQDHITALQAQVAVLTQQLADCQGEPPPPEPEVEFYLMSSRTSDRANPQKLVTVSSLAGNAFIFVARFIDGEMDPNLENDTTDVTFFIDTVQARVELVAPYDLAGTASTKLANAFDTKTLTDGPHQFSAVLAGVDEILAETVTIKNDTTTPPPDPPPTDVWNPSWKNLWGPRPNAIPAIPAGTKRVSTVAEIAAQPTGAAFVLIGGPYLGITLPFKAGQTVWLGDGSKTKIDGQGKKILAWPIVKNLTIYGGEITNFLGVDSKGQVSSDVRTWAVIGDQLTMIGTEFHHNKMGAVRLRNGSKLSSCKGHHNPMYDFAGASNCVIEHNDFGEGSGNADGQGGNRGTNKTAVADKCIYRYNYVHDTFGNGLWSDINNTNHEWFRNLCEDVTHAAIFLEVSCTGNKIIQNTLRRCGKAKNPEIADSYPGGSALQVSATPGTLVQGNTFEDCEYVAIALFQAHTGHEQWGNPGQGWTWKCCLGVRDSLVTENWIRGKNQIAMTLTGNLPPDANRDPAHRCGQKDIIDPASNNRFVNNHYPDTAKFMYDEKTVTRAQWESHGYS